MLSWFAHYDRTFTELTRKDKYICAKQREFGILNLCARSHNSAEGIEMDAKVPNQLKDKANIEIDKMQQKIEQIDKT